MNKVLQIVTAVGFGLVAITSTASAAATCTIENTGPSSVNVCVNTEIKTCTVTNSNTITIDGTDYQGASSGDAITYNNTTSGGSGSGDASNTVSTTVNITVFSQNYEGPSRCTLTTTTRTPVVPVVTPVTPVAPTPAPVKVLPKTSSTSPAVFAGVAVLVLALAVVVSRFGLVAYSKLKG